MAKKDKGRWITTDEGRHIHLGEDGKPDRGNPYVIAAMNRGSGAKTEDDFWKKGEENYKRKEAEKAEAAAKEEAKYHSDDGIVPVVSKGFDDSYKMGYVYDPVEMDSDAVAKAVAETGSDGKWFKYKGQSVRITQRPVAGQSVILRSRGRYGQLELFNKSNVVRQSEAGKTMDWNEDEKRFYRRRK